MLEFGTSISSFKSSGYTITEAQTLDPKTIVMGLDRSFIYPSILVSSKVVETPLGVYRMGAQIFI
jgi:hypothetical protein